MKICFRHEEILEKLSPEKYNQVISNFYNKILNPIDIQDKIEQRKNPCPVCFLRADGPKILKEIIKETTKSQKVLA